SAYSAKLARSAARGGGGSAIGRMVWPDHISRACRSPNSRPPAYRPESSQQMSQRARSAALDAIPPAGEMLTTESSGTGCSVRSSTACGVAALRLDVKKRSEEHTSELQSRFDLVC